MHIFIVSSLTFPILSTLVFLLQARPATDVYIEVQSRHVEVYSAWLHIHAHFTGLRHLMFHWPLLSAAVGISSNLFFLGVICALSWCHLTRDPDEDQDGTNFKGDPDDGEWLVL